MGNHYLVPSPVLVKQARSIVDVYRNDSDENRDRLVDIGIPEAKIRSIEYVARELAALISNHEPMADTDQPDNVETIATVDAIIAWRRDEVLPRVKIALKNDPLLRHFRPGKLQSRGIAEVLREACLLVDAIERNQFVPALANRGVNNALAQKGRALIASMAIEVTDAALARHKEQAEQTYQLEDQLDEFLAELEQCACAVFVDDNAALKRYRMSVIRAYVAEMHGLTTDNAMAVDVTSTFVGVAPAVVA